MQKKAKTVQKNTAVRREPGLGIMSLFLALFLAGSFLYQYILPADDQAADAGLRTDNSSLVRINEVMSANASAHADDNGKYSDWLELYNAGDRPVNLSGWTLTKPDDSIHPLTFPELILNAGEYLMVYADGKPQTNADYALHAPYKLTAAGDSVALMNASGALVDVVEVPSLEKNESYSRNASGEWETTRQYTPALANTAESFAQVMSARSTVSDAIVISEVMIKNRSYLPDEDGDYTDYIELHNTSSHAVNLSGYALSDSDANLTKWLLPSVNLAPDGYLLVRASGKDRVGDQLHASFKLSEGESVFLTTPAGQLTDYVTPELTEADQAWSLTENGYTALFPPTPGQPNTDTGVAAIDAQLTSGNIYGLYLSEIMASTNSTDLSAESYDWVEIYNSTSGIIDLSGVGLSDNANRPRKWQFPQGASINPGEYKIVYLTGTDGVDPYGTYCASFRLSMEGGYSVLLSTPTGELIDRMPVGAQFSNISYGRSYSVSGFRYYTEATPKAANTSVGCAGRAQEALFSVSGGMYQSGDSLTLTLSAPAGATIRYTTDCTDPNENSPVYSGPIPLSSTTIVRAAVYENDKLPSIITTQSYFFGIDHTTRVVSLVSDPVNLFDYYEGIYEKGPGAVGEYATPPYGSNNKGANFWMDWEKDANVELFGLAGETILSQGCGLKLQGQYSRAEDQKAFKLIARSKYGDNRFHAALFDDRPYTEYQSFVLRASGQDWDKTRMRDVVQTSLAKETDVMYQAAETCVVYINGQYWGQYNMRERVNKYSIAQWEGWNSDPDKIDIIKANRTVMHGSNKTFEEIISWIKDNGIKTQADIDYVNQFIDIDNYLDYVAVEIFVGNPDLLNVKRYRSAEEDGRWRWILFDTDWGFTTDTNSMRRWLDPRGAGTDFKTDNTLFVALMKNKTIEEHFLRRFNELMVSSWTPDKVLEVIDHYYQLLLPEIDQHLNRWNITREKFDNEMSILIEYAQERAVKMLYYIQGTYEFSDAEMNDYFADSLAIAVPQAIDNIAERVENAGLSKWLGEWNLSADEYSQQLSALRARAQSNPCSLLDEIYAVYKTNNSPKSDLTKMKALLNAAK